jgi:ribonucleoside-diphosphate reductase beta chain
MTETKTDTRADSDREISVSAAQKEMDQIMKRDGRLVDFDIYKIVDAIHVAMKASEEGSKEEAKLVAEDVLCELAQLKKKHSEFTPSVEGIQDHVEKALIKGDYAATAKSYILYRQEQAQKRERSLFRPRQNLKPHEYPELAEYVDAIRHSYWIHTEFNYTSDQDDFRTNVSEAEKTAIEHSMLAIAQIEVAVKTFWSDIYKRMPKPEVGSVGATFAESEVRHMEAYSHLLELLGLNDRFEDLEDVPAMKKRMDYLDDVAAPSPSATDREYTKSVLLFSLFIEHVSLFSQFLIIMSFNKHENLFSGISNVVEATSKEEQIHGQFGIEIVNQIRQEQPSWFDDEYEASVRDLCRDVLSAEKDIVNWIFADGELDFLPKNVVVEFIKNRMNNSLESVGYEPEFDTSDELVDQTRWFDEEIVATKHVDFFEKRSINYSKRTQSVTSDDLF